MAVVSKFKENRVWIIAYLVISLGFAGYLAYFYSFVLNWSKEAELREKQKPESVKKRPKRSERSERSERIFLGLC